MTSAATSHPNINSTFPSSVLTAAVHATVMPTVISEPLKYRSSPFVMIRQALQVSFLNPSFLPCHTLYLCIFMWVCVYVTVSLFLSLLNSFSLARILSKSPSIFYPTHLSSSPHESLLNSLPYYIHFPALNIRSKNIFLFGTHLLFMLHISPLHLHPSSTQELSSPNHICRSAISATHALLH